MNFQYLMFESFAIFLVILTPPVAGEGSPLGTPVILSGAKNLAKRSFLREFSLGLDSSPPKADQNDGLVPFVILRYPEGSSEAFFS